VTQAVYATFIGQPRTPDGVPENLGGCSVQDRLLRVTTGRENPARRAANFPIAAQLLQQSGREQRVPIFRLMESFP
jgi:hypothetical protein